MFKVPMRCTTCEHLLGCNHDYSKSVTLHFAHYSTCTVQYLKTRDSDVIFSIPQRLFNRLKIRRGDLETAYLFGNIYFDVTLSLLSRQILDKLLKKNRIIKSKTRWNLNQLVFSQLIPYRVWK